MGAPRPTDLLDRVDADDRVIGRVARQDVFVERAGFRVVHVLVRNAHGDVLLQRIGHDRTRSPGKWGSSVAGYVFAGEAPADAAVRRLAEEIGLQTSLTACGRAAMPDDGAVKFVHVFVTHAEHAEIVDREHIDELRFWSPDDITSRLAQDPDAFTETLPIVLETASAS